MLTTLRWVHVQAGWFRCQARRVPGLARRCRHSFLWTCPRSDVETSETPSNFRGKELRPINPERSKFAPYCLQPQEGTDTLIKRQKPCSMARVVLSAGHIWLENTTFPHDPPLPWRLCHTWNWLVRLLL
jgi:hypothetical protein